MMFGQIPRVRSSRRDDLELKAPGDRHRFWLFGNDLLKSQDLGGGRSRALRNLYLSLGGLTLALALSATNAHAVPVLYEYTGFINAVPIGLGVNETVVIRYGFDTSTPNAGNGLYELQSLNVTMGGFTTTLTNAGLSQSIIRIFNRVPGPAPAFDVYAVGVNSVGSVFSGLVNGFHLEAGSFLVTAGQGIDTWSDESLILSTSLLNSLTQGSLRLVFTGITLDATPFNSFQPISFSIAVVPEPSTGLLMALGLVGLVGVRR
jgi:PEP-CTERM motif